MAVGTTTPYLAALVVASLLLVPLTARTADAAELGAHATFGSHQQTTYVLDARKLLRAKVTSNTAAIDPSTVSTRARFYGATSSAHLGGMVHRVMERILSASVDVLACRSKLTCRPNRGRLLLDNSFAKEIQGNP
jgi:hypothetical protein